MRDGGQGALLTGGQKWHLEGLGGGETARHTTRKHQRENVAQTKDLSLSESREREKVDAFFSYVQLRLIG